VLAVKWKLELSAEWDVKNSKTKLAKFIRNCDDDAELSKCKSMKKSSYKQFSVALML
jgi:hypothetical protein